MTTGAKKSLLLELNQQGANALLTATFAFLRHNKISEKYIIDFACKYPIRHLRQRSSRLYSDLLRAYEEMGVIMATWFSEPKFLDALGNPLPLSKGKGLNSIAHLIRVSRVQVEASLVLKLMSQSPSVKINRDGTIEALRRVFFLPKMELPRAAFVVTRFLDTLQRNASARKSDKTLLLERSCHVSQVDLSIIAPMLRDIEARGAAFMDSIDGDIEIRRLRRARKKNIGELGVLVFAWTKPTNNQARPKKAPPTPSGIRKPQRTRTNPLLLLRNQ
jgi:hypothetical protein